MRLSVYSNYIRRGTWTRTVGVGCPIGSVDAFRPEGRGFESRSSRRVGTLGLVLNSQLPVALRRETPAGLGDIPPGDFPGDFSR